MKTKQIRYHDFEDIPSIYEYSYPGDIELLSIFPEAEEIIPLKINDWMRKKGKLICKETKPFFLKVNALKDSFTRAFWKEAYSHLAGQMKAILSQLKRLKKFQSMIEKPKASWDYEKLKEAAKERPIVELFDFQRLKRAGRDFVASCPFHAPDKTPSFHIFADNGFKCFGCGVYGDSITFIRKLKGYTFREAVTSLGGGQ